MRDDRTTLKPGTAGKADGEQPERRPTTPPAAAGRIALGGG